MINPLLESRSESDRLFRGSFILGVIGLIVSFVGMVFNPGPFFRAYLLAYLFCLGIALGCLVIVMLYHLTGGAWGFLIQHMLDAGTRTLPLMLILFLPLCFGVKELYVWARLEVVAQDPNLAHKQLYLNVPFFLLRVAAYFGVWLTLAYFLNSGTQKEEVQGCGARARRLQVLSGPGLVLYGLTITFASTDWIMSLQPNWYSTIFAGLVATGQVLSALAFVIVVLALLATRPPLIDVATPVTLNDLGNLLLTFVILWAYLAFSQFLLIWVGNLPEEISWYLPRLSEGWQGIALLLVLFHFALPFLFLLSRDVKRNPRSLGLVAATVLGMRFVDLFWQVMPAFPEARVAQYWMHGVALIGVGGIWLAFFSWQLQRRPLLPPRDPNRSEAGGLRETSLPEVVHHD